MKQNKKIIKNNKFNIIVERLSHQLIENHGDFKDTVLIGIQPRGTNLSNRIHKKLSSLIVDTAIKVGNLDITFYRDDFRTNVGSPQVGPSDIKFDVSFLHTLEF